MPLTSAHMIALSPHCRVNVFRATRAAFAAALLLSLTSLLACNERQSDGVDLTLHPVEMLATRNGPKIVVLVEGKPSGELSAAAPTLFVPAAIEGALTFAYVGPNGESTDV